MTRLDVDRESDTPRQIAPTVLAMHKTDVMAPTLFGHAVSARVTGAKKAEYAVHKPMSMGLVDDWSHMALLWSHMAEEVGLSTGIMKSDDFRILVVDHVDTEAEERAEGAAVLFDDIQMDASAIAFIDSAAAATIGAGRTTALVVESGASRTVVVPVVDGKTIREAAVFIELGGEDGSAKMREVLAENGTDLSSPAERLFVTDMKEKHGYVALDYKIEDPEPVEYDMFIDTVTLKAERVIAGELIFRPNLLSSDEMGLSEAIAAAIGKGPDAARFDLWHNIVLAGGNVKFPGMKERLMADLASLAPESADVKIFAAPFAQTMAWMGASMIAAVEEGSLMEEVYGGMVQWVTKEQYAAEGASLFDL